MTAVGSGAPMTMLFDQQQIAQRLGQVAADIAKSTSRAFTVVEILKGSFTFIADLMGTASYDPANW